MAVLGMAPAGRVRLGWAGEETDLSSGGCCLWRLWKELLDSGKEGAVWKVLRGRPRPHNEARACRLSQGGQLGPAADYQVVSRRPSAGHDHNSLFA